MSRKQDYFLESADQVAQSLGARLSEIRLGQNRTQAQIATEAGISRATLVRLEQGNGASLDTFIRVMMALRLHAHLEQLLPDPSVRPLDRVRLSGRERQRARPKKTDPGDTPWAWGNDE